MHTDICIPYSPQVLPGHEVNNIVIQTYVPTLVQSNTTLPFSHLTSPSEMDSENPGHFTSFIS